MDLGVAKLQEASVALTLEGQFTGSLLYAAPEQCDAREVGPASDMYALGVMLYELATGQNPFRRDNPMEVIKAHVSFGAKPAAEGNEDLSLFFSEVVATLISKDPADLYQMHDRGTLEIGKRADLNLIDFENLCLGGLEVRTDLPAGGSRILQSATGYLATFVDGVRTREGDEDTGRRPGRLVRGSA